MNKKVAALLSGTAALITLSGGAQAASPSVGSATTPQSYAELLDPIPNAIALMRADDAQRARHALERVQLAQYHHHHHHHHHAYRGGEEGAGIIGGIIGGMLAAPPAYVPRHCYWTRGEAYWTALGAPARARL